MINEIIIICLLPRMWLRCGSFYYPSEQDYHRWRMRLSRRSRWAKEKLLILIAEWCLHTPLTTGPVLTDSSKSVLLEFPLTVIPIVSGSLGPRIGQLATATTATMANVYTFLLTLKEVERCLLCSSNRCVKAWRLKDKEGDGENYVIY